MIKKIINFVKYLFSYQLENKNCECCGEEFLGVDSICDKCDAW